MKKFTAKDLDEFTTFACELADASRKITLEYFKNTLAVENKHTKSGFDPVTIADQTAEKAMRAMIEAKYPDHGIYGEEFGHKPSQGPWTWYLDPIDGTRAFIAGLPTWGTLIGLTFNDSPILGIVDQPRLDERFIGVTAGSSIGTIEQSTRNGSPIQTSDKDAIEDSICATTSPDFFTTQEKLQFDNVKSCSKLTVYGLDCYAYATLATGKIDIVIESGLKPYDMMALIPVIKGAGGFVSDWSGAEITANSKGDIVVAANQELHKKTLHRLTGSGAISSRNGIISS